MKSTIEQKELIYQRAEEIQESNQMDFDYEETDILKSRFTCLREAINYVYPEKSKKLADIMALGHENETYNQSTKNWNKY